jgi:hypothetical protein
MPKVIPDADSREKIGWLPAHPENISCHCIQSPSPAHQ